MSKEEFFRDFSALLGSFMKSAVHENLNICSRGEIALLSYLAERGAATPGDLTEIMNVGSGRVANALNNLEKKGYIERKKDSDDKRKTIVTITERGLSLIEEKKREFVERSYAIYDVLGAEDADALLRILRKFEQAKENK